MTQTSCHEALQIERDFLTAILWWGGSGESLLGREWKDERVEESDIISWNRAMVWNHWFGFFFFNLLTDSDNSLIFYVTDLLTCLDINLNFSHPSWAGYFLGPINHWLWSHSYFDDLLDKSLLCLCFLVFWVLVRIAYFR